MAEEVDHARMHDHLKTIADLLRCSPEEERVRLFASLSVFFGIDNKLIARLRAVGSSGLRMKGE